MNRPESAFDVEEAAGVSVDHAFASAWDDGLMLGSSRTWWRVASAIDDQSMRPVVPTRCANASRTPREAPVLTAAGPGQVWSCYADVWIMPMVASGALWLAGVGAGRSA